MNPAAFESGMMLMGKHPSQLNAKQFERRTDLDLAQYLEQQQERTKQEAAAGKSAEYFFKANPQALKELNLDEPSLANMSAADKYTAMVSYGKAQMEREAQQKRQMDEQTRSVFQDAMARRMNSPLGGQRPDADGLAAAREAIIETAQRTGNPELLRGLRDVEAAGGGQGTQDLGAIQYDPVPGMEGAMGWRRGNMAGIVQDPRVKAEAFGTARNEVSGNAKLQAVTRQLTELNRKYSLTPDDLKLREKLMDQQEALMKGEEETPNTKDQTPNPAPAGENPTVSSQAEYDALPPGATYTTGDGKIRRKAGK